MCPSYTPEVINLTVFFSFPTSIYLYFTNYSCSLPLLFPRLFLFLRGTFTFFLRINMRKPQFSSPSDMKKKYNKSASEKKYEKRAVVKQQAIT